METLWSTKLYLVIFRDRGGHVQGHAHSHPRLRVPQEPMNELSLRFPWMHGSKSQDPPNSKQPRRFVLLLGSLTMVPGFLMDFTSISHGKGAPTQNTYREPATSARKDIGLPHRPKRFRCPVCFLERPQGCLRARNWLPWLMDESRPGQTAAFSRVLCTKTC